MSYGAGAGRSGHRIGRGGHPPLVRVGIRASHMDDRPRDRNGSAAQRPDARGNTSDIQYIYMRNRSDRGLELINEDSWWWLKRNSDRVFNDAKTAEARKRSHPPVEQVALHPLIVLPNVIAIGAAGSWPLWSVRTITFYGLSLFLWLGYFYGFIRLLRWSTSADAHNANRA